MATLKNTVSIQKTKQNIPIVGNVINDINATSTKDAFSVDATKEYVSEKSTVIKHGEKSLKELSLNEPSVNTNYVEVELTDIDGNKFSIETTLSNVKLKAIDGSNDSIDTQTVLNALYKLASGGLYTFPPKDTFTMLEKYLR